MSLAWPFSPFAIVRLFIQYFRSFFLRLVESLLLVTCWPCQSCVSPCPLFVTSVDPIQQLVILAPTVRLRFTHNEGLNSPNFDPRCILTHRNNRVLFRSRHARVFPCPLLHQTFFFLRPKFAPTLTPVSCTLAQWQLGHRSGERMVQRTSSPPTRHRRRSSAISHVF